MDNLQIFSGPKSAKYGYQLNPYNTMIGALYEYHIAVKKIKRPMSDTERREWEAMVWKYFDKCMFSCSRCHLPEYPKFPKDKNRLDKTVTGRLYEQLFDIINYRMRLSRAIAEIYDKKSPAGGQNS